MKTIGFKKILFRKEKKIMTRSKIGYIQLINSINWLVKVLFVQEIVKNTLKKDKNDIFYKRLQHISKTYNKKVFLMINNSINENLNKICFYKLYINLKII